MAVLVTSALFVALAQSPADPGPVPPPVPVVRVFSWAAIKYDPDLPDGIARDGYIVRDLGQTVQTTLQLPPAPTDQRHARQVSAIVDVRPVSVGRDGQDRPGDVWTRLGCVSILAPGPQGPTEVELLRFTTGFGGAGTYTADLTALAPLLHGRRTLRVSISTYTSPAWEVSLRLAYRPRAAGYRRPVFARGLFNETAVTADSPTLRSEVDIPTGLAQPRLRVISTDHSTDGGPANEFVTCTHLLRIDGREVARWRPWAEGDAGLARLNPWSGRRTIDGRELRSSDLDRSGWQPGLIVEPLVLPVPELTPGRHEVELEIVGIRPEAVDHARGYWRVSAAVVADEPWPPSPPPPPEPAHAPGARP